MQGFTPPAWQPNDGAEPAPAHGFSFAAISPAASHWPVRTNHPNGRIVSFRSQEGDIFGNGPRRFCASRSEGARFHVGVDLYGVHGDIIVATEPGRLVNHYHFYHGTHALFVQCDSGLVINYGEVAADSWQEFGLDNGSPVAAGQPIARVGKMYSSSMCHFETLSRRLEARWIVGSDSVPPTPRRARQIVAFLRVAMRYMISARARYVLRPATPSTNNPSLA
jgi:hypothetical protein